MAHSDQTEFDGYRKWLGIPKERQPPTIYELLAISLDEDDPEVIRAAAEQRRSFVESKRGEGHEEAVNEILYQIGEAEFTLLDPEMRRDYDRRIGLFEKRKRRRQVDPNAPRTRFESRPGRSVGEESGIVRTFAGIMAVLVVGMGVVAWLSFGLPWSEPAQKKAAAVPVVAVPVVAAAPAPVAPDGKAPAEVVEVSDVSPAVADVASQSSVETPEGTPPATSGRNDSQKEWQTLFDGRTLNGWTYTDRTKTGRWVVRDGAVVRLDNTDEASDLMTTRQFEDFELEFDFLLGQRANSGVYLRGRFEVSLTDIPSVGGGGTDPSIACGGIFGQVGPDPALYEYRGTGNWNMMRIRLVGDQVTVWLNGKEVVSGHRLSSTTQGTLFDTLEGAGPVVLQKHRGEARFKNVRICPLNGTR